MIEEERFIQKYRRQKWRVLGLLFGLVVIALIGLSLGSLIESQGSSIAGVETLPEPAPAGDGDQTPLVPPADGGQEERLDSPTPTITAAPVDASATPSPSPTPSLEPLPSPTRTREVEPTAGLATEPARPSAASRPIPTATESQAAPAPVSPTPSLVIQPEVLALTEATALPEPPGGEVEGSERAGAEHLPGESPRPEAAATGVPTGAEPPSLPEEPAEVTSTATETAERAPEVTATGVIEISPTPVQAQPKPEASLAAADQVGSSPDDPGKLPVTGLNSATGRVILLSGVLCILLAAGAAAMRYYTLDRWPRL